MDRCLKGFLTHLKFEINASSHTVRAYESDIKDFYEYLRNVKILKDEQDFDPKVISHIVIRGYIGKLLERNLEKTSINRKLSSLRTYFDFLVRENICDENPAKRTLSPKTTYKTADFLSLDDVLYLLDSSEKIKNDGIKEVSKFKIALKKRNRAIFEVLYSTGIRVGELVNLDTSDVNFGEKIFYIKGKGQVERIVPFGDKCKDAVNSFLNVRAELTKKKKNIQKDDKQAIFLNRHGKRLKTNGVGLILKRFLNEISLHRKVTPHTFRHTAATHLLNSGADMVVVKELLGHKSLATTQKYTHVTIDKLMKEYDKAHPRGRTNARREKI